jgi:menaquinol-cytochrome c reductase iron-sulfur subunit
VANRPEDLEPENENQEDTKTVTRRRFLGYASGLLSAIIAAAMGIPLLRFYIGTTFKHVGQRFIKLGAVKDIPVGRPELFRVSFIDQDGWLQTTTRASYYVVPLQSNEFLVLSNACTHLGCPVSWDEQQQLFLCPCHNGGFSLEGNVVKGPPPRPLEHVKYKLEGNDIYVQVTKA